jgi:hypothetical protein
MSKNYQFDIVQKPKHYTDTGIEHSDVVEAWNMDYFIGNCTKYLCRWEKKANPLQDLKKAAWYLARKIAHLEFPGLNTRESIRIVEAKKESEYLRQLICNHELINSVTEKKNEKKSIITFLQVLVGEVEGEINVLESKVKK